MDYNNDWYERYQNPPPMPKGHAAKHQNGVRVSTLIICMLITTLLGGAVGGLFAKTYVDQSMDHITASLQQPNVPTATPPTSDSIADGSAATAPSAQVALQSNGVNGYSKAQIIELCAPSVVGIDTAYSVAGYSFGFGEQSGSQTATGSGSGILLTSDGYIVTCKHVVDGAETITVILNDDTEHKATLIGSDVRYDLAVIKIEATGLTPATLGDSDMLTVGEDVIAIGNPLGELRGTATDGIISALGREVTVENTNMTLVQTNAAISPGNSGGGLFNASGSLIGIVNAKASSSNSEGLGFAIPVNSVKQVIGDLMDHGYVRGRAYLGIVTQNVTLQSGQNGWGDSSFFGSFFGSPGTACVQVAQIVANSAAEKAGLQVGDLIVQLDDTQIMSNEALSAAISAYNAGDTATITVQRAGQQQKIPVTFGEYTPAN
ncbi:MAG: trypsin-like peptidase domain-containing protein [Clostridia bacterium]